MVVLYANQKKKKIFFPQPKEKKFFLQINN